MRFTWDPRKAASNARKHGVSFPEAATVFADVLSATRSDASYVDRLVTVGMSERGRILFVVHAEWDDEIRIISARKATIHERRDYEEGT
jgi:uncharacterized DUF497 family protein